MIHWFFKGCILLSTRCGLSLPCSPTLLSAFLTEPSTAPPISSSVTLQFLRILFCLKCSYVRRLKFSPLLELLLLHAYEFLHLALLNNLAFLKIISTITMQKSNFPNAFLSDKSVLHWDLHDR